MGPEDWTFQIQRWRLRIAGFGLTFWPFLSPCVSVQPRLLMKWPQETFSKRLLAASVFPGSIIHFPAPAVLTWTTSHESLYGLYLLLRQKRSLVWDKSIPCTLRIEHRDKHCKNHHGMGWGPQRALTGSTRTMQNQALSPRAIPSTQQLKFFKKELRLFTQNLKITITTESSVMELKAEKAHSQFKVS